MVARVAILGQVIWTTKSKLSLPESLSNQSGDSFLHNGFTGASVILKQGFLW